jgi:peptide-methionine (S)-S-oxide reductase
MTALAPTTETAVFGGGCFWCTEAVFKMLRGVRHVSSGYAGGSVANPSYEQVSGGRTGHAEVIRLEFDPNEIRYRDLLTVFFASHDPTTPNRQGHDVGPQYRSIILTTSEAQKTEATQFIAELNASTRAGTPITTDVAPLTEFYPAEGYHQDYYANNPSNRYCELIINPKLKKVQQQFDQLLKTHEKQE